MACALVCFAQLLWVHVHQGSREIRAAADIWLAISRNHKAWVRTLTESILKAMPKVNVSAMASLIQVLLDGMIVNAYLSGRELSTPSGRRWLAC